MIVRGITHFLKFSFDLMQILKSWIQCINNLPRLLNTRIQVVQPFGNQISHYFLQVGSLFLTHNLLLLLQILAVEPWDFSVEVDSFHDV